MIIYEYECKICGNIEEIHKEAKDSNKEERCEFCRCVMTRIYNVPRVQGSTVVAEQ